MGNLGAGEIILIVVVILIFFGPKKIPEIAQGIGKGMREFKKAMKDVEDELVPNSTSRNEEKRIASKDTELHAPAPEKVSDPEIIPGSKDTDNTQKN
jgi:TatA/E family protein of Tat protein translocase